MEMSAIVRVIKAMMEGIKAFQENGNRINGPPLEYLISSPLGNFGYATVKASLPSVA
jgi:hypothetical protein